MKEFELNFFITLYCSWNSRALKTAVLWKTDSGGVTGNNPDLVWMLGSDCWLLTPHLTAVTHRGVWGKVCTWVGGSEGGMKAFGVHTAIKRPTSCVSAVIRAFFSDCVKVKTELDYRAFWRATGSVCERARTQRLPFWTQAVVAFLALGAGSERQLSRNLGII